MKDNSELLMPVIATETVEKLKETSLFQGFASHEIETVLQEARPVYKEVDEFFFHQGAAAQHLFILLGGQVKVIQLTPEGQQVVMRLVNPIEIFGCVAALSKGEYPASAQATKECQAFCLTHERIHRLMEVYPRMAMNAFQIMVQRTHTLQDRYRELATECVERRLAHTLLRLMQQNGVSGEQGEIILDMPLSKQNLAEMIGSTLYTVSRILSAWEGRQWVQTGRAKLSLLDPQMIEKIAEAEAFSADLKSTPI